MFIKFLGLFFSTSGHVQLPNGYPNMIPYVETKNFAFQPIIPLRSNLGLECDPKLRKNSPRT